jgi:hypothetical protein
MDRRHVPDLSFTIRIQNRAKRPCHFPGKNPTIREVARYVRALILFSFPGKKGGFVMGHPIASFYQHSHQPDHSHGQESEGGQD